MSMFRLNIFSNLFKLRINKFINSFHTSPVIQLKEIKAQQENETLVVSGEYVKSPREDYLMKEVREVKNFCPACTLGLDIKHTDVLIISQYLRSDGCMLPRRITGLCAKQQKRMSKLVAMAQKAGLMPNLAPENSKRDPKRRFQFRKYNRYFDEKTIRYKRQPIELNLDK